jgi:hypothetical protein
MRLFWCGHKIEIHQGARFWEYEIFDSKGVLCAQGFSAMAATSLEALTEQLKARAAELSKPIVWATESAKPSDKAKYFDNKGRPRNRKKKQLHIPTEAEICEQLGVPVLAERFR